MRIGSMRYAAAIVMMLGAAAACAGRSARVSDRSAYPNDDAWKAYVVSVPIGSELKLKLNDGRTINATLAAIEEDHIVLGAAPQSSSSASAPDAGQTIFFNTIKSLEVTRRGPQKGE